MTRTQKPDLRPAHVQLGVQFADTAADIVVVKIEAAQTHAQRCAQATVQAGLGALAVTASAGRAALQAGHAAASPDRVGCVKEGS